MSTKTSIKRIALVAVAALGFGMVSTVSSSATEVASTKITALSLAAAGTGRIGTPITSAISVTSSGAFTAGDNATLRGIWVGRPAGSTAALAFAATGAEAPFAGTAGVYTAAGAAGNELYPAKFYLTATAAAATANKAGVVGFTPDVAGTYVLRVWHDADGSGTVSAGETAASDLTVTVGNAPTVVSVSKINGTAAAAGANGALVKISLTDSSGVAAGLANGESLRITPSTATADITLVNGSAVTYTPGATTYLDLSYDKFIGGVAWVNITDAAGTPTFALAGQGTAVANLSATFSLSFKTISTGAAAGTATTVLQGATAGAEATFGTDGIAGTTAAATVPVAATTLTYFTSGTTGVTTGDYALATITDTNGKVTGSSSQSVTGLLYDIAYLLTETTSGGTTKTGSFSVSLSPSAASQGFSVTTTAGTDLTGATVATAAVVTSSGSVTATPSAVTMKTGSKITYNVTVKDQFGRAYPNATVKMVVTGRNANQTVVAPSATTDANGITSFSLTDGPVAGTTSLTDSIVFTAYGIDGTNKASSAVTIAWVTTDIAAGTVTILGGNNTTTGVAAATPQYKDINAGDGAEGTTSSIVATVKDASGNLLAGVPVTFTVSGTGAAITTTTATVYTGAAGTATAYVYAWVAGSYTVTATAGGKSGTAVYQFRQSGAGEERVLSASVEGSVVTAKVVDRFGNPVPAVTVYATKSGAGYFGNGTLKTSTTTDNNGEAQFVITGGAADVTVSTLAWDAAAGTNPSGQTCAAKGYVNCVVGTTAATAFTATTAGTATKDAAGVGASYDAAGVSSATVSVNASATSDSVDAANEATDAANAATDAANAAAEAADAATAAAQDAQAAVAALATQVASLIAGIKAQITTLTNLVIKIQKKVKA